MTEPVEIQIPIEDWIDLHTFLPKEVASVVEEYLYQVGRKGFRDVRTIHGRGAGVQREIVHSILRRHPDVLNFRDAQRPWSYAGPACGKFRNRHLISF
jgi:DNA-nicking Smr family endonuclease